MKYAITGSIVIAVSIILGVVITRLIARKHPFRRAGKWLCSTALALAILLVAFLSYVSVYYHADQSVQQYLQSSDTVTVSRAKEGWYFDGPGTEDAIVFYPGAKVEETAYAPLMFRLARNKVDCYLVKMPLRLAFLDEDVAGSVISSYQHETWYIMGHSLGGSMAAMYAADQEEDEDPDNTLSGIIFLASYSTTDLDIPALSVYGSEDGVLNRESYESDKAHLKGGLTEKVIAGGNHGQFGNYGHQSGDGTALISADEQQKETADSILEWIRQQE